MIYKADSFNRKRDYICQSCGQIGRAKMLTKGSRGMEIFLWTVLLVPGPFYSLWRHMTRVMICVKCQETTLVPLESPKGQELFERAMRQEKKWGMF